MSSTSSWPESDERGNAALGESGPVGPHEQLAVGVWTSADADGRDAQFGRDLFGGFRRNHFEHDRERPSILNSVSIREQGRDLVSTPLDDVTAESVLALRGKPNVSHHRNAGRHDPANLLGRANAALELHGVRAGLLHEPEGRVERLVRAGLVGAEGHVGDDKRALHGARNSAGERDELIDRDGKRRVVAENVVRRRIAHQ